MLRRRVGLSVCGLFLFGLLVSLRHHFRDLVDVARTYTTFFPWIEQHPEALFRLSANSTVLKVKSDELTPRILHQIYLSTDGAPVPERYTRARESCTTLHPNWTHELWTGERATAFVRDNYPEIYPHYIGYKQNIQRANILRYALLHSYGGVYLDLDVQCLQPLDPLLRLPLLTPGAYPAGINNAFILTRPGHGFFRDLLRAVPSRDLKWGMPYVENMLSTGCMFFSNRWMDYVRSVGNSETPVSEADKAYILSDEHGNMDPHMLRGVITTPLFHHDGASSWHKWDAAVIVLIGKYYGRFLFGLALLVTIPLALMVMLTWRSRRKSLANWNSKVWTSRTSDEGFEARTASHGELVKRS